MIYTKFVSAFKTEVKIVDFFSFKENFFNDKKTYTNKFFLFDSSKKLKFQKMLIEVIQWI